MLAGGGRHHHLEVGVGVDRHVLLPRRVAADGAEEGVGRRIAEAVGVADGEPPHQLSVEADLELLGGPHADDVVVDHPAQPELHAVLAVEGEIVADGQPAAGPERQVLAHAVVLVQQPRRRVRGGGEPGADGGVPDREPADAVGGGEVAVEQGGRHREGLGVGAEPFLAHVVGRKQQPAFVDLQIEEAAHRVAVLGRGQAAHGGPAGVGALGRGGVKPALEPAEKPLVNVRLGARPAGRRHHAEPQLADNRLPHIGVGPDIAGVEPVEGHRHQPPRLPGRGVAREAVALHERLGGRRVVRNRGGNLAGRCRHRRQRQHRQRRGEAPESRSRPRRHRRLPLPRHCNHRSGRRRHAARSGPNSPPTLL